MIEGLATAAEYAIIVAIVGAATQFVKQKTTVNNNWLPLVAVLIGVLAGIAAVAITHDSNYVAGALQGAVTAMATSWAYDAAGGVKDKVDASKQAKADADQAKLIEAVKQVLAQQGSDSK